MASPAACPKCGRAFGTPTAACPKCQAAGTLIDSRYLVEYELGRGQFGVVYRAIDQRMARRVAVKMLRQEALDSEDAVRRFQEEARILGQVHHSNVLTVHDQGTHEGKHYIVFPFIEGKTLKDLIPATGFPDPARAARLVARLAEALHYVHSKHNILHRDVKPANLMQQDGDENSLYLMDFGLAVCHQTDLTRATQDGTVMGTPRYMSPEQAKGQINATSHQSDLYSAAVVLFELLTGRTPFLSPWPALIVEIIQTPPPAPSSLRPGLDPRLDAIVLKGLAKDPAKRYQTGKEFAEALEAWSVGSRVMPPVAVGATTRGVFGSGAKGTTASPPAPGAATRAAQGTVSPPAVATGQGSSIVTGSTVNNPKPAPKVVVRTLTPPAEPAPAPKAVPPARPAPRRAPRPASEPEPVPTSPRSQVQSQLGSGFKMSAFLLITALSILLIGVAAVIWAVKWGPSKENTDPQKGSKIVNKFRDGTK